MVPEGWDIVQLGDVAEESKKRFLPTEEDSRPYVGLEHIDTGSPQIFRVGISSDVSSSKTVFQCGDILFGKLRPYLRKVAFAEYEGVCSTDILAIRGKNRIDARYLHAVLSSERAIAHSIDTSAGTKMPRTSWQSMSEYSFLLPPLPEQKKIAAILSSVDEAIASTQAVINQTRKVKQGLLQQLLTRGIGHTKFKESAIGKIPEFWKLKRINELGKVQAGRQRSPHFTEGKIRPYLRVANVFDGYIDTSDVLEMAFTEDEYKRYCLQDGDILLNEGQSLDLVGRSAIYRGVPKNCCFQNTLIRFRAYKDINIEFAQTLFQFLQYSGRFSAIALQTTSIAHLGVSRFASLEVMLPPYEEQCQIAEIFFVQQKALNTEREKLLQLQILKCGLMQDLLTGKVRVGGTR
jgi:type I restriction enzyme S subunit